MCNIWNPSHLRWSQNNLKTSRPPGLSIKRILTSRGACEGVSLILLAVTSLCARLHQSAVSRGLSRSSAVSSSWHNRKTWWPTCSCGSEPPAQKQDVPLWGAGGVEARVKGEVRGHRLMSRAPLKCSASRTEPKKGWRSAADRDRRRSGSYSNKPSNKSKKRWCSSVSHNTYLWQTERERTRRAVWSGVYIRWMSVLVCKCTAVILKLKCFTHSQRSAVLSDVSSRWRALVPVQTASVKVLLLPECRGQVILTPNTTYTDNINRSINARVFPDLVLRIILEGTGPCTRSIMARCSLLSWV